MKKVAIIGTAGLPAKYGGFETLAHHLVNQLNEQFSLFVYCSGKYYKKGDRPKFFNNARLFYIPFNANGAQSIIYDIISIIHALFICDTLIILGVSGCIILPFVKLFTNKKIIVNIDGLEWKRDKWSKPIKRYLKFSESLAVRFSDANIADNAAIKAYTLEEYGTVSQLIEYGADHVNKVTINDNDKIKYTFLSNPYAFKVCRIEPENNVHIILESFAKMQYQTLVMVGNWKASNYGSALKEKYSRYKHIYLLDPIYVQREIDLLRSNCKLYIHGHSAGGTNPSLVEAMYLGLPVVAFHVSYNIATTENKAFYFQDAGSLEHIVRSVSSEELFKNSRNMAAVASRRYLWKEVTSKYAALIQSVDQSVSNINPSQFESYSNEKPSKEVEVSFNSTNSF